MVFQLRAVMMQIQNDLSPQAPLAAESPLMNLLFTNKRRQRRTKDGGTVKPEMIMCPLLLYYLCKPFISDDVPQIYSH